ncbi:hypothetical protein P3S67_012107 [Capsicum chacoense]
MESHKEKENNRGLIATLAGLRVSFWLCFVSPKDLPSLIQTWLRKDVKQSLPHALKQLQGSESKQVRLYHGVIEFQ